MPTTTIDAYITPTLITWARERSNYNIQSLSEKIKVKPEKLSAWEKGLEYPTFRQAEDLANKLRIPFGFLFLSNPPEERLPLPDLRTKDGEPPIKPSPDFLDVLYDALRKQQWYHDYLRENEAIPVPFIGRFTSDTSASIIAEDIRRTLGITNELRKKSKTWEGFLTELIHIAENARIVVFRSGVINGNNYRKLNTNEFKGFAISDELAPLVFINEADYKTAQIFTLAHEFAHLWIGKSGISNPEYRGRASAQNNAIERVCDSIAAEILVPGEEFLLRWLDYKKTPIDNALQELAAHYRVSAFVILRRLYELDKITTKTFQGKYNDLLQKTTTKKPSDRGNFYTTLFARNSAVLTSVLVTAANEGRVSPREAAKLLNVRINTLSGIESELLKGSKRSD